MDSLTFMCFLSIINYSNILRIKIKSVYVKDFLISTKVRLKRVEHLHGEEPISSEPTFRKAVQKVLCIFNSITQYCYDCVLRILLIPKLT